MTMFWILAGALLVAVVAVLLVPIIKTPSARPRYLTVLATGAGLPGFALGMYLATGHWQATDVIAEQPANVEAMVAQLAGRLQQQGGTFEEWRMLGRSYMVTGRYADAVSAYGKARQLEGGNDVELTAQFAEALVLADGNQLAGEAGRLFEQVLAQQPLEPRALWYGGMAALGRGENALAIERWQTLLGQNPPDELRQVLHERIAEAGGRESPPAQAQVTESDTGTIRLSVTAKPGLLNGIANDTPLFVLARGELPGPPLAVRRMRVGDLPFEISLSDKDAMMAGRNISNSRVVELIARIALGGSPEARSGDLYGQAKLESQADNTTIALTIDQRVD